jgi:cytidine deaminase
MNGVSEPAGVGGVPRDVDWEGLREAARAAMRRAYAPYSRFPVGAGW